MTDLLRNLTRSAEEKRREALSAYLDEALSPRQRRRLEDELARDAGLRARLEEMRTLKQQLRQLPARRVPRNFMLDPALYGRPQRQPLLQLQPALRVATVLTAFFFVLAVGAELFLTSGSESYAPLPANQDVAMVAEEAAETVVEVTRVVTEIESFAAQEVEPMSEDTVEADVEIAGEPVIVSEGEAVAEEPAAAPAEGIGESAAEEQALPPSAMTLSASDATGTAQPAAATERARPEGTPAPTATPLATATVSAPPRPSETSEDVDRAVAIAPTQEVRQESEALQPGIEEAATSVVPAEEPAATDGAQNTLRLLQILLGGALLLLVVVSILARRRF